MIKQVSAIVLLVSFALSALAIELTEEQRAAIEARLTPHGDLCVSGDSACVGAAGSGAAGSGEAGSGEAGSDAAGEIADISGEAVYNEACMACHNSGAGGAPMVGQVDQWSERLAKGREELHQSGIKGIEGTSMMAKGGRADLSDEQVIAAVDYMIDNSSE